MQKLIPLIVVLIGFASQAVRPAWAHGDEPHPKCKPGYVLTDDHRCMRR